MKLGYEQQLEHLKQNGVTFNNYSEQQALEYLKNKNHFFRLKSYCKNYEKKPNGDYIHLDFSYLVEMAEIDRQFRKYILRLVIHIEHILKQRLLRDLNANEKEDGFNIVCDFMTNNPRIQVGINQKKTQSVCHGLISKYEERFAVWNIVEILSFGEMIQLYKYYYQKYPSKDNQAHLLHHLKFIRNAVAHNNCLLNTLKKPYTVVGFSPSKKIRSFISEAGISKIRRERIVQNPVLHDFIVSLYVLINISTDDNTTKNYLFDAKKLLGTNFKRNITFFNHNTLITSVINILEQIIDAQL